MSPSTDPSSTAAARFPRQGGAGSDWLLWQLLDSAFPTGGFAHSAGLEAAAQQGEIPNDAALGSFFESTIVQAGRSMLPVVLAARAEPSRFAAIDAHYDAMLRSTVANRASRAQGQAYLIAAERTFAPSDPSNVIGTLRMQVRREQLPGHFAPALGASAGALGIEAKTSALAFLFLTLRGVVSAAVRLGITGPMQAQAMQYDLAGHAQQVAGRFLNTPLDEAAQTAPLIDILQGGHDRLYSRLFQS